MLSFVFELSLFIIGLVFSILNVVSCTYMFHLYRERRPIRDLVMALGIQVICSGVCALCIFLWTLIPV